MNPRVSKIGRSFKGAGQYYLHDKKASTSDRVAFIETLNLPTNDAQRAIAHMIDTAEHSDELKLAAGFKRAKVKAKPVYSYALSWHPSETPTEQEQKQAAYDTIKLLGLEEYQAVIVAHNDTPHPHVHVIVNRVHPETGIAAVMSNDQLKLSEWALEYQQERGQNFTPERVKNAKERAKGKWIKHTPESRRERDEWKKATTAKIWDDFRAEKEAAHKTRKPQYDALWQQRVNRMAARKAEIKQLYKPVWRDLFKRQRKDLANFDAGVVDRIAFAWSRRDRSIVLGLLEAIIAPVGIRHDFLKQQEIERVDLGIEHKRSIRDASREVHKAWQYDRDQLKDMHKDDDKQRYERTKAVSKAIWEDGQENTPAPEQTASQDAENAPQQERAKRTRTKRKRKTIFDTIRETTPREELERAEREVREEAAKERKNERDYGRKRPLD